MEQQWERAKDQKREVIFAMSLEKAANCGFTV
jgi:hypothetical protein